MRIRKGLLIGSVALALFMVGYLTIVYYTNQNNDRSLETARDVQSDTNASNRVGVAQEVALDYWTSKYGDSDITISVKDFGCHLEATVLKGRNIVKRLSINPSDLNVYETG